MPVWQKEPHPKSMDDMRKNLKDAAITVALVTPTFFKRSFCLIELGAVWVQEQPFIPMVMPPLGFDDLKGTLEGIQAGMLDHTLDLARLKDQIVAALKLDKHRTDEWEPARERFLADLKPLIEAERSSLVSLQAKDATGTKATEEAEGARQTISGLSGAELRLLRRCLEEDVVSLWLFADDIGPASSLIRQKLGYRVASSSDGSMLFNLHPSVWRVIHEDGSLVRRKDT